MRKQRTKRLQAVPPAHKVLKVVRVPCKPQQLKWIQAAQMPDYLAEDHPELCNS
ncbi:MAG TPA: hypothetical protein VG322_12335 [Candidatus Acidoferrales bacterium]|nr:hypothetical protein [Candidatus Acidoferrales bacterium]